MNNHAWKWTPAAILLLGALLTLGGVRRQVSVPLRAPLDTAVPTSIADLQGRDITIDEAERRVAGMSDYVMRRYAPEGAPAAAGMSVYVGYYDRQTRGKTIHSPKNCLPGAGWEPLVSRREAIATAAGAVTVNRYLIQRGGEKALVLYWYQGRGRVAANEYAVKWNLLRDQALRGRSDEALVRVIVPVTAGEEAAHRLAVQVAATLVPTVERALPA